MDALLITRAKNQLWLTWLIKHFSFYLHFVSRDKKVVLNPQLLLARERYAPF